MSLAFNLFCLWLVATAAVGFVPGHYRGRVRFGLLVAGGMIVVVGLLGQGPVVALFAAAGVLTVFPEPLAWARVALQDLMSRRRAAGAA